MSEGSTVRIWTHRIPFVLCTRSKHPFDCVRSIAAQTANRKAIDLRPIRFDYFAIFKQTDNDNNNNMSIAMSQWPNVRCCALAFDKERVIWHWIGVVVAAYRLRIEADEVPVRFENKISRSPRLYVFALMCVRGGLG